MSNIATRRALMPKDKYLGNGVFGTPNCLLWVDFSDITTLFQDEAAKTPVTGTGQNIGRANNKGGSGYFKPLSFSNPNRIPKYTAGLQNGLGGAAYTWDELDSVGLMSYSDKQEITFFYVMKQNVTDAVYLTLNHYTNFHGITNWRVFNNDLGVDDETIPYLWVAEATSTATNVWKNGTQVLSTGAATYRTVLDTVRIGGTGVSYYPVNSYIYEVMVFIGKLPDATREMIQTYLNAKWAIY